MGRGDSVANEVTAGTAPYKWARTISAGPYIIVQNFFNLTIWAGFCFSSLKNFFTQ